jgi:murein DD-endopeptidase
VRRLAVLLLVLILLSGCAKRSRPSLSPPAPPRASGTAVVALARSLVGTPYRNGGADPGGFDCSGFVQYVFGQLGISLPRSVSEQATAGEKVAPGSLREGDLVLFAIDGRTISHVGIAVGADAFVHAPSSRGRVREESLSAAYWQARFAAARRILGPGSPAREPGRVELSGVVSGRCRLVGRRRDNAHAAENQLLAPDETGRPVSRVHDSRVDDARGEQCGLVGRQR